MQIIKSFSEFNLMESKYPENQGKILVVLGAPGSGKGTLSKELKKEYGFIHISTGDLIRKSEDPEIKKNRGGGKFLPDDLVIKLIKNELKNIDLSNNIIIDGFPRTVKQAKRLDKILGRLGLGLNHAIMLNISDELAKKRIKKRAEEENREDDLDDKIIEKRFDDYYKKTKPITELYDISRKLIEINASNGKDNILHDVAKKLNLKKPKK